MELTGNARQPEACPTLLPQEFHRREHEVAKLNILIRCQTQTKSDKQESYLR